MADQQAYQVYISCLTEDENGRRTRGYVLGRQLWRRLNSSGISAFLPSGGADDFLEAARAARESVILILVGDSAAHLNSEQVRGDYEAFRESVYADHKTRWRIVTYLIGMPPDDLPEGLRQHRSFDRLQTEELIEWIQNQLNAQPPKQCIADTEEEAAPAEECEVMPEPAAEEAVSVEECEAMPESVEECEAMPESAEVGDTLPDAAELFGAQSDRTGVGRSSQARRRAAMGEAAAGAAPTAVSNDRQAVPSVPPTLPMPSAPSVPNIDSKPAKKVKPTKINKVDFSVVAPERVKPGSSALVDVLMYTGSQRKIVERVIQASQEKAVEAARTSGSVSVKQGSLVTVVLSSDDVSLTDNSETLVWSGDALDFSFRFTLPEAYQKKSVDFACNVLFDGIHITRLYFSVPVNAAKAVPIRFVRKDSRRAFVSYSHRDKQRVVEQLCAIQSVAPKLKFWMDNQSMSAGEQWRPAILSAIRNADVFLLFWSRSSRESAEVRKEWEYALALEQSRSKRGKNGARFISPVPLDDPKDCPPPAELNDLHFGDPSFDQDIDRIDEVNFVVDKAKAKNIRFF